ncbi:MAG: hypothetical protein ACP5SB_02925 [Caldisericaceae bacterium]
MKSFARKALIVSFVVIFLFQFKVKLAKGDAGPVFAYGLNIAPYQENNVTLVKETLSILLQDDKDTYGEKVAVNAKFVFVNEGEKAIVKMGFPFGVKDAMGREPRDISVKVDGKSVNTTEITVVPQLIAYSPWVIFDVAFNKGETKTVDVSYRGIPLGGRFVYILETGRFWKGPIGTLDISIKFSLTPEYPYLLSLKPQGYSIAGNEASYHFVNFEPYQNIEIEFLPEEFYNKIKPFKDKAEKTNSASDWFNYALSLLPENPFGPFRISREEGGFADSYRTNNFQDYVLDTLDRALLLQKEGSTEQKILSALKVPREQLKFIDGFADSSGSIYNVDSSLFYFGDDVTSPMSDLEGKMISFLMEYKVYTDFKYTYAINGVNDLNTLLKLADRYFNKEDLDITPYIYSGFINPSTNEPIFMECFVPEVSIVNSKVIIQYNLPYSMQNRFLESGVSYYDPSQGIQANLEQFPPYAYLVTIDLSSAKNKKDLDLLKTTIKNKVSEMMPSENIELDNNSFWARFVGTYLYDILDNVDIDSSGKIYYIKSSLDCTPKIEKAISDLDSKTQAISGYKSKFEGTTLGNIYLDTSLNYLSSNRKVLLYAKAHPFIYFEEVSSAHSSDSKIKDYAIIILSILLAILAALSTFLFIKIKHMRKSS